MPRRLTALLLAFGLSSLSGGPLPDLLLPECSACTDQATSDPTSRREVAEVAAFLRQRHTGLLDSELAELATAIVAESQRAGFSSRMTLAVIDVESSGYNFAVSEAGALGLMQLRPVTAEAVARRIGLPWGGPTTLFDPVANVRLGVHYLESLTRRFGDLPTALAAYNWGPTRIAERIRRGDPIPVQYTQRVLAAYGASGDPARRA